MLTAKQVARANQVVQDYQVIQNDEVMQVDLVMQADQVLWIYWVLHVDLPPPPTLRGTKITLAYQFHYCDTVSVGLN